jgi:hypothetical protein
VRIQKYSSFKICVRFSFAADSVLVKKKISRKNKPASDIVLIENLEMWVQSSTQVLYEVFKLMSLRVDKADLHSKQTALATVVKIINHRKLLEFDLVSNVGFVILYNLLNRPNW